MRRATWLGLTTMLWVASASASAATWNVGTGYNFVRSSGYVSIDARRGQIAAEVFLMSMGGEEPTTNPGPEWSLDVLGYLPALPVFAKAGVVAGWRKHGENVGCGVDWPVSRHWFLRLQDTLFHATEDQHQGIETENIISLGAHYRF